ncbi:hypothetical protein [Sphingomonas sp.]|uniref:hypothetical protein n=1 Tax=Sphingomonas sp. TaxID=28214 RepID=UPI003B00335F
MTEAEARRDQSARARDEAMHECELAREAAGEAEAARAAAERAATLARFGVGGDRTTGDAAPIIAALFVVPCHGGVGRWPRLRCEVTLGDPPRRGRRGCASTRERRRPPARRSRSGCSAGPSPSRRAAR